MLKFGKNIKNDKHAQEEIRRAYIDFLNEMQRLKKEQLKVLADFERRLAFKQSNKILKKIK